MKSLHKSLAWLLVPLPMLFMACADELPTDLQGRN